MPSGPPGSSWSGDKDGRTQKPLRPADWREKGRSRGEGGGTVCGYGIKNSSSGRSHATAGGFAETVPVSSAPTLR